ncbi:MAG: hypothetical protein JWL83_1071 [Actinomycetia bacterium]|nr:hypothetical protein [Actinomycetes bacterium]
MTGAIRGAGFGPPLRSPSSWVLVTVAMTVLVLSSATPGMAYFSRNGAGTTAAAVARVTAPRDVHATSAAGTSSVHLAWVDSVRPDGPVKGYYVQRLRNGAAAAACGTSPSVLVPDAVCDDSNVADGSYTYVVIAVFRSWNVASVESNLVSIAADHAAPSATLAFPADGGHYNAAAYTSGCNPIGMCGSVSDGTGVHAISVSVRAAGGSYWNGTTFGSATEVFNAATLGTLDATATTWNYALALPPDAAYTVRVQARDTVGNAQTGSASAATAAAAVDTIAPVLQSLQMFDTNANGKVDTVVVTFNEPIASTTAIAPWTLLNGPSNATLAGVAVAGSAVTLQLSEGAGAPDTAVGSFTVALSSATTPVRDLAGNAASFVTTAPVDRAGPVVVSIANQSGSVVHAAGKPEAGDTLDITFSEAVQLPATTTISVTLARSGGSLPVQLAVPGVTGSMDLGASDYFQAGSGSRSATFANSTLSRLAGNKTIRVTLGSASGDTLRASAGGPVTIVPASANRDLAGNAAAGSFTFGGVIALF